MMCVFRPIEQVLFAAPGGASKRRQRSPGGVVLDHHAHAAAALRDTYRPLPNADLHCLNALTLLQHAVTETVALKGQHVYEETEIID